MYIAVLNVISQEGTTEFTMIVRLNPLDTQLGEETVSTDVGYANYKTRFYRAIGFQIKPMFKGNAPKLMEF